MYVHLQLQKQNKGKIRLYVEKHHTFLQLPLIIKIFNKIPTLEYSANNT